MFEAEDGERIETAGVGGLTWGLTGDSELAS